MNKIITTSDLINDVQLMGFFEGDGTLKFQITCKKPNKVYISVSAVFAQHVRNREILEIVKAKLSETKNIYVSNSPLSSSPLERGDAQLEVSLGKKSKSGQKLIEIFRKNKPLNPGNLKDYLIFLIISAHQNTETLPLSGVLLQNFNAKSALEKSRSVMLTLLWLRFQRAGQTTQRRTLKNLNDYFLDCRATSQEIHEAKLYGEQVLKPVDDEVHQLVQNLETDQINIEKDYLAFYHVADGCLKVEVKRENRNGKPCIQIVPCWQLSDDRLSEPLLKRIQKQYNMSYISQSKTENGLHLRANGWEKCKTVVLPFFRNVDLPKKEFQKYQKLERLFELHSDPDLKKNYHLYFEYIKIAYFLNVEFGDLGSNSSRTQQEFDENYVPFIQDVFNNF